MSNIFPNSVVYGNFPFLIFICISAAYRESILDPQGYLKTWQPFYGLGSSTSFENSSLLCIDLNEVKRLCPFKRKMTPLNLNLAVSRFFVWL